MSSTYTDVAIVGTGIIGIATAYYLAKNHRIKNITLLDESQPMGFTSAQSGENYRNWWPRPEMVAFMDRSIDLLEAIANESNNLINMSRRGYALATRTTNIDEHVAQLREGLQDNADRSIRFQCSGNSDNYQAPLTSDWKDAPDGVDILQNRRLIKKTFPGFAQDIQTVIHIRRAGDISSQQLGSHMLEYLKLVGAKRIIGSVVSIEIAGRYNLEISSSRGTEQLHAEVLVNAAGPFADVISRLLGIELPVYNTFQQKIAFEDRAGAIRREMPFSIDLDGQKINWSDDERELLASDREFQWLAQEMPGSIHCRPDGGDSGSWVKLGWAYNARRAAATWEKPLFEHFPDIVVRGASRMIPSLEKYVGRLPRGAHHYGGWYTMTEENWPLIGPMGPDRAFINCAHSGFGTMGACASGELCAAWIADSSLPDYANEFSLKRYEDDVLMCTLKNANKGVL